MLSLASCLSSDNDVAIFWDGEEAVRSEAERKFAMDLANISFTRNIFSPNVSFLKRFKESRKYDLIIVLSDGSIPFLFCPTVLHFQTPSEWVKINGLLNRLKFFQVKHILCNSQYTKSYIDKKFGVRSSVLYPPVSFPENGTGEKENIILNVGRYGIRAQGSSFKKQEVLRDVFLEIGESLGEWEMVFILNVSESEREAAQAFSDSVKSKKITVLVSPDNRKVAEYYRKAKIYWHAAGYGEDLKKYPDRAEHFGLSTVEAMHYGCVPIVINAGGQPEIVTDDENGFLWNDTDELKKKTLNIIHDAALMTKISEKASDRADYFSIDRFCRELRTIIT